MISKNDEATSIETALKLLADGIFDSNRHFGVQKDRHTGILSGLVYGSVEQGLL